jgi:hypothetical protein
MEEKLGSGAAVCRMHDRLRELLGPNYVVSYDTYGLDRLQIYPKGKGFWARISKIAEVIGIDEDYSYIEVNGEEIYPQMKQFGEEFGFEVLERNWPGADIDRPAAVNKSEAKRKEKPKLVKTCEYLIPRYEQIGKDER